MQIEISVVVVGGLIIESKQELDLELQHSMENVKKKLLSVISLSILIIGVFFLFFNFLNELNHGDTTLTFIVLPLYFTLVGTYIFREKVSYTFQAYANLLVIFMVGIGSVYFYGMIGPGILFFLTASYMGSILLEKRQAIFFIIMNIVTFIFLNWTWVMGWRSFSFNPIDYSSSFETFLTRAVTLMFFIGLIVLSQYKMNRYLISSMDELQKKNEEALAKEEEIRSQYEELALSREVHLLNEEKYHVLIENTEDMIYSLDTNGAFLSVNSAFEKVLGIEEKDLIGKVIIDVIKNNGDVNEAAKNFNKVLHMKKAIRFVGKFTRADNKIRTYHLILTPVFNSDGEIEVVTGRNHDITKLLEKEEQIKHLAYYDQLTKMPNRVLFEQRLTKILDEKDMYSYSVGILYLDLDNFKKVNDTMGHHAGDRLLIMVTERLIFALNKSDILSRLSGDEFAILLRGDECYDEFHRQLEVLANVIVDSMREPIALDGVTFYLSASIGIVIYPEHGSSFEELMKNAESAMYKAKHKGKNQYLFFHEQMKDENNESILMEAELRDALLNGELNVQYHPLVKWGTGDIRGFEALMRWKSPIFGKVSPAKFIPLLEQTGLIIDYGEWIMQEACEQNRRWQELTGNKTTVSVNISPIQLKDYTFIEKVKNILSKTKLNPQFLEIEITESIFIDDFESVVEKLKELRRVGIRIALDDFGTGYSSLNYLRQLPIDTLKIDKSFIRDIVQENQPKIIIGSIISLAHEMGLEVVAEGIEIKEQAAYLQEKQCDWLQGFYYYYPLDKKDMEKVLLKLKNQQG